MAPNPFLLRTLSPLIWGEQEFRWPPARYVFHYHSSDFPYCPGSLDPLLLHLPPQLQNNIALC